MGILTLEIITYSLALWLGLYLIARDPTNLRLRYAGLGVAAYAFSLATGFLALRAPTPEAARLLARLHWPSLFLPAFFWFVTMLYLLPEASPLHAALSRVWRHTLWLGAALFYLLSAGTRLIFDFSGDVPQAGSAYLLFVVAILGPMLLVIVGLGWRWRQVQQGQAVGLLLVASIFFGLAAGLLLFPLDWLPRPWLLLGISLDFIILGGVIAWVDAFEEGERLLPDLIRAFEFALFGVLLFGGLVLLTIQFGTGLTFPMLLLLLGTITAAIISQTWTDAIQAGIDRIAFAALPHLRRERAELRATASALPRLPDSFDPDSVEPAKFVRLTRRALSHMGDLSRLAGSPLTHLPMIDRRLRERAARDDTLERAAELRSLLIDSIERLKPRDEGEFGTTEAWRYYNALYYPYVAGLKPYSRRADYSHNGLSAIEREALDWFRSQVPERTLYNWQNVAAKLIAQDLRERSNADGVASNFNQ